ncbi:MAG: hypothetical protein SHS37scaffold145_53 [Phage 71_18]|nr:MAG: hypothetical protein SHS37scaffold145_53 [Phage 71_18]
MGRASRAKAERRAAHIEVICPGMLEVLSVGKGDIKLTLDGGPGEVENARRLIEEMLRKGYGIFVETDAGLARVKEFNPRRMTYIISEFVDEPEPAADVAGDPPARTAPRRTRKREVPVAGSSAKAIGRTAGG